MEKYSALDKGIYIAWTLLLFIGASSAALNVLNALTDPSYFQYRSLRHMLFSGVTASVLTYLSYALASGIWKGKPDTALLITSSKIGNLLTLFGVVAIGMIFFIKMDADSGTYSAVLGGFLLGGFGVFTRRRFRKLAKKNPAMK